MCCGGRRTEVGGRDAGEALQGGAVERRRKRVKSAVCGRPRTVRRSLGPGCAPDGGVVCHGVAWEQALNAAREEGVCVRCDTVAARQGGTTPAQCLSSWVDTLHSEASPMRPLRGERSRSKQQSTEVHHDLCTSGTSVIAAKPFRSVCASRRPPQWCGAAPPSSDSLSTPAQRD